MPGICTSAEQDCADDGADAAFSQEESWWAGDSLVDPPSSSFWVLGFPGRSVAFVSSFGRWWALSLTNFTCSSAASFGLCPRRMTSGTKPHCHWWGSSHQWILS
jgi:hypothetical protein